jgi:hypothetical protein
MSFLRDSGITGYAVLSMRRWTTVYRRVTFAGIGQFPVSDAKLPFTKSRFTSVWSGNRRDRVRPGMPFRRRSTCVSPRAGL